MDKALDQDWGALVPRAEESSVELAPSFKVTVLRGLEHLKDVNQTASAGERAHEYPLLGLAAGSEVMRDPNDLESGRQAGQFVIFVSRLAAIH